MTQQVPQYLIAEEDAPALLTFSANGTAEIPAGYAIDGIYLKNTTANIVTGGIKIGTTAGGTDVVASMGASGSTEYFTHGDATILKRFFSRTLAQTLYVQAVTAWNAATIEMKFALRRLF